MSKKAGECPPNERGHHLTSEPGHGYSSHLLHTTLVPNTIPGYLRSRGCCKGRPAESAAEHQKGHSLGTHRPLTQQGGPWPCGRSPDKGLPIQRGTDSSSTHHEHARLLLQVPLLLQVGQHACAEEDFALADAVQVAVELQGFYLGGRSRLFTWPATGHGSVKGWPRHSWRRVLHPSSYWLTSIWRAESHLLSLLLPVPHLPVTKCRLCTQ